MKNFLPSLTVPSSHIAKAGIILTSLFAGQWIVSDLVHLPSGGFLVLLAGAGFLFLYKPSSVGFVPPSTVKGWIKRCNDVLSQFESLEDPDKYLTNSIHRTASLNKVLSRKQSQSLEIISTKGVELPETKLLQDAIVGTNSIEFASSSSLPLHNQSWEFPHKFVEKDLIIYYLPLPLRAVDLLWLKSIPSDLPSWILISYKDSEDWPNQLRELHSQLPDRWVNHIIKWDASKDDIKNVLSPVRRLLNNTTNNIDQTRQRLLSRLHLSWQSDLECLRRDKFRLIQNRSQWLVAGAVFASPLPSTDLLSVAVVNGLMIQEMGKIWSCDIKPELLTEVARQLAIAALAQGVVEWSGQALLSVAKLHGGTWLAAGSMQAVSAAYLTRVVGTSMADWMALNNGVAKPDLDLLKLQAPGLISKAAEKEKVNWSNFLVQSKNWALSQINDHQNIQIQTN